MHINYDSKYDDGGDGGGGEAHLI